MRRPRNPERCIGSTRRRPQASGSHFFTRRVGPRTPRSWVPLQESPAIRITYSAVIHTPPQLRAVMSAENHPEAPTNGEYRFRMPQSIPSYLIALAVGDLAFRPLGPRTGVFRGAVRCGPGREGVRGYREDAGSRRAPRGDRTDGIATTCWCCRLARLMGEWRTPAHVPVAHRCGRRQEQRQHGCPRIGAFLGRQSCDARGLAPYLDQRRAHHLPGKPHFRSR